MEMLMLWIERILAVVGVVSIVAVAGLVAAWLVALSSIIPRYPKTGRN